MGKRFEVSGELLERAGDNDIKAFEEIYRMTSAFVYNVALRITCNQQDAEEVTQDVFIKVYRNLKNFRFRSAFSTWLYRIAVNTAINKYRRKVKEQNLNMEYKENVISASDEEKLNEALEKSDSKATVDRLLRLLDEKQRTCLILREIEGLSYEEIKEVLKIPINTVRTRLKRAREKLLYCAQKELIKNEV
ncbi:MAG: sigma-70 family RNA polymerase sigma factor [Candidatus Omnitrophica bacterium]|nr:sigma-70 family RNA polymerase sigma factor [Candidatus Omnitrophota bacterium]